MGGESELFRIAGAQLYLVDGDESVLLQRGEFVLLLVKNSRSPLAAVVAMVGDMQWPVGKDSFVSKLGDAGFSFSNLPARLKFALSLDKLETAEMQKLEFLFEEYSTYMHGADSDAIHAAGKFWTRLAKNVDTVTGGCIPVALSSGAASLAQKEGMEYSVSPKLVQRMQQARRMSAIAKLFARIVERGAINASTHVKKLETDVVREGGRTHIGLALASVDAVAKVVEAVETAGKTLLENTQAAGMERAESKYGHRGGNDAAESLDAVMSSMIMSAWTLNKVGLRMFFRTISSINSSTSSTSMRPGMVSQCPSISIEASGCSSTASDLASLSSISSKSSSVSTENNIAQAAHATKLAGCTLSTHTSARPVGAVLFTDATSTGTQPAPEPSCLPCRPASLAPPPRFGDRAAHRPPSLPPRFYGAPVALDRVGGGVTTTLSLASGGSAGPGPPSLAHAYRPQATQLPSQTMAMGILPPCPPRPPPRPRFPFHRHP